MGKHVPGEEIVAPATIIHDTAEVAYTANIGRGTKVWHWTHIMEGAEIGEDCMVGQACFIGKDVKIGNRVKLQNNVFVPTGVTIEGDVFCGPYAVFTNVKLPRAHLPQKEYTLTLVKKGATIGANSTIICGNIIGKHAMVGAGSVVTHDVPNYGLVYGGNPARLRGWMCECKERLKFKDSFATCHSCGKKYRIGPPRRTSANWYDVACIPVD